jgi:hypothetical protein
LTSPSRKNARGATESRRWRFNAQLASDASACAAGRGAAISSGMSALKAHVVNGQIVLDEPAELAEGAELLVFPVGREMSDDERAERERAIEEGIEDFERGDFEDARELACASWPSGEGLHFETRRSRASMRAGRRWRTTRKSSSASYLAAIDYLESVEKRYALSYGQAAALEAHGLAEVALPHLLRRRRAQANDPRAPRLGRAP